MDNIKLKNYIFKTKILYMQQAIKNIFDLENAPFIDLKIKPNGYQKYIESKKIEQFKVDLHRVIDKINKKNNS